MKRFLSFLRRSTLQRSQRFTFLCLRCLDCAAVFVDTRNNWTLRERLAFGSGLQHVVANGFFRRANGDTETANPATPLQLLGVFLSEGREVIWTNDSFIDWPTTVAD
ncbi:hypothetical protein PBY51_009288 [Eleginops maclovinus]|uniref:Uncharacterized protein n=1 Tax=Eleginops maclovinus TaxID=56733 RepID=A0AAN8AUV3_ELEMC|nr:hypothetical protein PBY51_009288 [Eleginops maclovinus]